MIAINDAFFLESCIYELLRRQFRQEAYYTDLLDLFHEVQSTLVIDVHVNISPNILNFKQSNWQGRNQNQGPNQHSGA